MTHVPPDLPGFPIGDALVGGSGEVERGPERTASAHHACGSHLRLEPVAPCAQLARGQGSDRLPAELLCEMTAGPLGIVHVTAARLKVGLVAFEGTHDRIVAVRLTATRDDTGPALGFVIGQDARPGVLVVVCGAKPVGPIGAIMRDAHDPCAGRLGAPIAERKTAREFDEIGFSPDGQAQPR